MKNSAKQSVHPYERKDANSGENKTDITEIKSAVENMGKAWEAFKSTNDDRLKEIEKKGAADPLHTEQLNKINGALEAEKQRLDQIETAIKRTSGEKGDEGKTETKEVREYVAGFKNYIRKGFDTGLAEIQAKTMSVSSDPDGGYTVTPQMSSQIITKIFETSPIRQLATVETISTDALDIMSDTDTAVAGWTGEQSVRTGNTTTPQLGKRQIYAQELYAKPKATQKLLDDSAIDIEGWLAGKIGDIFARTENTAFVLGTGIASPRGFMTYASGTSGAQIEQIGSGSSGAFTADGLLALQYGLKDGYQANATFLMTRMSEGLVRKLKDGQGRYIWEPSFQVGVPNNLLGKPIMMAADIAEAAGASLSAIYGDFKKGYTIVDRMGVRVLRDPFTDKPFVQFYTTKRVGGDVTNFEALKIHLLS